MIIKLKKIRLLFLLFILFVLYGCEGLFFHPSPSLLYHPELCVNCPEDYVIDTVDGMNLHAWLFRAKEEKPKGTVIFMHGNSRNMSSESLSMLWLLKEGYNLFVFDYRGYGVSKGGKPTRKGIMSDGAEALDAFIKLKNIDKTNIIIWGQSLGGAAASYTAANSPHADKAKILVLDSTFTSWRDIAKDRAASSPLTWLFQIPASMFYPDNLSSKEYLPKSKIKNTLIIHSTADAYINIKHAEKLYEIAKEPKELFKFDAAKHAQIMLNKNNHKQILDYFDKVLKNEE